MALAISSGRPIRPMGCSRAASSRVWALWVLPRAWGVSTGPGTTQLTRMPWEVYWPDMTEVRWMTPTLLML